MYYLKDLDNNVYFHYEIAYNESGEYYEIFYIEDINYVTAYKNARGADKDRHYFGLANLKIVDSEGKIIG